MISKKNADREGEFVMEVAKVERLIDNRIDLDYKPGRSVVVVTTCTAKVMQEIAKRYEEGWWRVLYDTPAKATKGERHHFTIELS